jgi:hypothetical protein
MSVPDGKPDSEFAGGQFRGLRRTVVWRRLVGEAIRYPIYYGHRTCLRRAAVTDVGQNHHPDLAACLAQLVHVVFRDEGPDDLVNRSLGQKQRYIDR